MALISLPKIGVLLAATGAAHFATPETFEQISKPLFPTDTRDWVLRNGAAEVGLGLGLMLRRTRKLAVVGLLGYVGFLGSRAAAVQAQTAQPAQPAS
ncbi:MAG: hypothetical protein QOE97_3850 [Pseudonocardiales bacterium]|jgi:uncharacterized membrane protein|nr:hypothetical protein [Pseudonocardiales bacterium]